MSAAVRRKDVAIEFLTLASSGQIELAFERCVADGFRHHNPWFHSDAASLMAGMKAAAKVNPNKEFVVQRALEDETLVAVHSRVRPRPEAPVMAVVHIFRFEGNKIAELWDVGQATPENAVNSMFE